MIVIYQSQERTAACLNCGKAHERLSLRPSIEVKVLTGDDVLDVSIIGRTSTLTLKLCLVCLTLLRAAIHEKIPA